MSEKIKFCPLKMTNIEACSADSKIEAWNCEKEKCMWYIKEYRTKTDYYSDMCSIKILARRTYK